MQGHQAHSKGYPNHQSLLEQEQVEGQQVFVTLTFDWIVREEHRQLSFPTHSTNCLSHLRPLEVVVSVEQRVE